MLKNFKGYELFEVETKVKEFVNKDTFTLMYLEETVFFPESAGQVEDKGVIIFEGNEYQVLGLNISDDQVVHKVELIKDIQVGSQVKAKIDRSRRDLISANHSAAHLLFDTIRELYPTSVGKGYFNDDKGLRIDMQIDEKMDWEKIYELNRIVAEKIATPALKKEMIVDAKTAKEVYNLSIEFNEKELEGDLRIVEFEGVSRQLCSGTHVLALPLIQEFLIYNFETKGSNIYRFYAKTDHNLIAKEHRQAIHLEFEEMGTMHKKLLDCIDEFGFHEELAFYLKQIPSKLPKLDKNLWTNFIKVKMHITKLREALNKYNQIIDSKIKDRLFKTYSEMKPSVTGENNTFYIKEKEIDNKHCNFVADLVLKNNPNSYVEIVVEDSNYFFCKSNCSISAIERMKDHPDYIIKGGGNEKTAQGNISPRSEVKN
ncbi:alanine--tRNA ligase-related protein [Spiroplasma endosymbiont of Diplazon laetatorius]|uniref:alanine--tRNA ligase-related protein n=1 Tax=Spiroplasma endosymbiont of Diplazon laetatorius TaxID=3066322 RepID=UPI0030CC382C